MKKNLKIRKIIFLIFSLIIITFIIFVIGKLLIKKLPIKIGLVNTLSGPGSTSAIHARDAAILAVEHINKKGGINGRLIELIIKDDKFDPDIALQVDKELIKEGVIAIIGHSYSSLCLKVVPLMNEKNILMISPTAMSAALNRLDDNFIRLTIPLDKDVKIAAQVAFNKFNTKKMVFTYDLINPGLSIPVYNFFKKEFESLGGKIITAISFNSKEEFSAPNIVQKILQSKAEGLYIVTDAIHASLICQHLRLNNLPIDIIVHGWGFNDPIFINEGGKSVENVICISTFDTNSNNEHFVAFKKEYFNRFGHEISAPAQLAYEAMQILFITLAKTRDPKKIKDTIIKQKEFDGLDGKIFFDKYGDPYRTFYILQIQKGIPISTGEIGIQELLNY